MTSINGYPTYVVERRPNFEDLTPIFPNRRLSLEVKNGKEYYGHAGSWTFWPPSERAEEA